jgi:hypothetical protein
MNKLWLAALLIVPTPCGADEKMVPVPGTKVEFPVASVDSIGDQQVSLRLTGVALRQKAVFNVYAIASYVAQDAKIKSAEALAEADAPKQLKMVMERDVTGKDVSKSMRDGIEINHPKEFADELKSLDEFCKSLTIKKGTAVTLTHVPGAGLSVLIGEKSGLEIRNVKFSLAVWQIYLGKKNISERLRRGLTSRL